MLNIDLRKGQKRMEETNITVPYIVYESAQARHERTLKRLIIIIIIAISMLFASNAIWIYMWSQYDTVEYDYTQDGRGVNIIGSENEVRQNGAEIESSSESQEGQES